MSIPKGRPVEGGFSSPGLAPQQAGAIETGVRNASGEKLQRKEGKNMKQCLVFTSLVLCMACPKVVDVVRSGGPLTESEVVSGLKEALITGSTQASKILSAENGYFGDAAVKLLLPEEARVIVDNLSKIPGGDKLVADFILRVNRAAEDAAKEMAPIFMGSIRQMTVKDGFNILKGADNAATAYLRKTSYRELHSLYKPKIEASTKRKIVGNISAMDSWNALTGSWNEVANSVVGKHANLKPVHTDLNEYLITKALNGAFLKLEAEEFKIRKDVKARVTPLLQKVFGSLDKK